MTTRALQFWTGLVLLGIAALAAGATARGAEKSAEANLDGVWQGFVVEGTGENPNRGPTHLELTIKGNQISAKRLGGNGGFLGEGLYKLTPGQITMLDAVEVRNQTQGRVYLGICMLGPDVLKWCVATPGKKRPMNFQSKGQQFLLILKRQK